jgi:hypothetical protein
MTKGMMNDGDFVAYDGRCAACDDLRRIAPLIGATGAVIGRASARHGECNEPHGEADLLT